ncbi:MAG: efflux RND transporter periplasmic adaptor subunit [Armatimonadetes bacterium]|nr:efflux RND transporter periplasmic adaptor subunit [Armatimonadota bacterium]
MSSAKQNKGVGILILIGFIVVGGGAYQLGRSTTTPPPSLPKTPRTEGKPAEKGTVKLEGETFRLANLEIGATRAASLASRLTVTGQVEPNLSGMVKVTPRTEGKIIQLLVNVGDTVRAGQTLAVIQSEKLHEAQIAYRLALKKAALAHDTLERRKKLAGLGEYGKPPIEEARARVVEIQGNIQKERDEVATAQSVVAEMESQRHALQVAQAQARARKETVLSRSIRAEALFKEQLISRQDWEQAQAEVRQAQADIEAAGANLAQGEAKIDTAKSRLNAAKAVLESARKQGEVAQQKLARSESVYKGAYLTSKEVSEAVTAYEQAQIEVEGYLDDIELLGGKPGDLHSIPVLAPIGGRVTERLATLGETVAADKALLVILNAESVWVQLNIYPKDVAGLRVGQEIRVTAEALPGRTFRGVLSYISDTAEETTRTVKVRCAIQNGGGGLKPGIFVNGEIVGARGKPTLTVPKDAVQFVHGKPVVYVPTMQEGEFREQSVETGAKYDDVVEILSGLKAGDRLVTKNAFLVKSQAMKSELGEE